MTQIQKKTAEVSLVARNEVGPEVNAKQSISSSFKEII
jgi:hypothetical protein